MSILSFSGPRWTTKRLTLAALLTAVQVILGKISVGDPAVVKVGLGFIATAMVGYCLGPWMGGVVLIINDLISNTILNTGSMFFPGFTFSAFVSGVLAGLFLYHQRVTWQRMFIYEFFQILISNVFFTTLWLYIMGMNGNGTGKTFWELLVIRLPKEIITWPIESLIVLAVLQAINKSKVLNRFE